MSTVTCIYEKSSSRKIATSDETLVLLSQDIMGVSTIFNTLPNVAQAFGKIRRK
jgi:hypothetical protein